MKPLSFSPALRNGRIVVAVLGALLGAFPAPPCSAQLSLGTSFGGATPSDGVMFDVRALSSVVLQAFDLHLASGTWDLEVYVVTSGGSFQGVETNAAAWTLVASVTGVMSNGSGVPTPLGTPVNVPLLAGAVQGVYVTATNGPALLSSAGTAVGLVAAADADLVLFEGAINVYPFLLPSTPFVLNGVVHYAKITGCNLGANITINGGAPPPPPVPIPRNVPQVVGGTVTSSLPTGSKLSWSWYVGLNASPVASAFNVNPFSHSFNYTWTTAGSGPSHELKLLVSSSAGGCAQLTLPVCVHEPFRVITSGSGIGDAVVIGAGSPCFPTAIDGYTGFSFNPSGPVGGGPLLGLYPDPLVFAILSVPPSPGNLFHFLFDGMSYPDAPISFPPGTFTPLAGISMDALQIYLNAGSAQPLVYVSAVSRVTF